MNLKERAAKLKKDIPIVYCCLKNKKTPGMAKVMAAITIVYALSPIDLVPDFIPVLGYLDDIILLPLLVVMTVKLIPKEIWDEEAEKAQNLWVDGKPKKWIYAIPIIIFWGCIIIWLLTKVLQ